MTGILRRALLLAPLTLPTLACYTYAPIDAGNVSPGAPVRARVSGAGAEQIAAVVPGTGRVVDGHLEASDSASILLRIPSGRRESTPGFEMLYQRVRVPRTDVLELEYRRLDPVRTGLVAAGGAVLAAFVASRVFKGNEPGVPQGGGDGGNELTGRGVPLGLRLPVP